VNRSAALAPALAESAQIVARVAQGRSLTAEFERLTNGSAETPRSALMDLSFGTLRRYGRVQAIVRELSRHVSDDVLLDALLWCSIQALESGRYAEHTVVHQAVGACGLLEKWNAKGYVNAVLRRYLRERSSIATRIEQDPEARYQHPAWWIAEVKVAYPEKWESVLAAGNLHPPMCLRINRRRQDIERYQRRLCEIGIASRPVGSSGLLLDKPVPTARLPGFDAGDVSVQDAGAQRAAHCLDLAPGQRVLDACAAPGGKSAHILESADVDLTCLDERPERVAVIERTLNRLQLSATTRSADCTKLEDWWDGRPYDRVLADVPCSASGVARRHPDLKWLRRPEDVKAFAERQSSMLDALWQVLAPNGKLLYATCSVFPRENEEVVEAFVERSAGARRSPLPDGATSQWLPGKEHDGVYFALVVKQD
jgi:16S rRNA (cytosine967-C5)-methyltransferase